MSVRPYDSCTLMHYRTSGMQTVADIRIRSRNNGRSGVAIEWCTSRLFTVYAKINNATPDSVTCLYKDVRAEFQSVGVRQLTLQQKRLHITRYMHSQNTDNHPATNESNPYRIQRYEINQTSMPVILRQQTRDKTADA